MLLQSHFLSYFFSPFFILHSTLRHHCCSRVVAPLSQVVETLQLPVYASRGLMLPVEGDAIINEKAIIPLPNQSPSFLTRRAHAHATDDRNATWTLAAHCTIAIAMSHFSLTLPSIHMHAHMASMTSARDVRVGVTTRTTSQRSAIDGAAAAQTADGRQERRQETRQHANGGIDCRGQRGRAVQCRQR